MPKNGYWIECVPVQAAEEYQASDKSLGLYSATIQSFPDLKETAPSPDIAIEKLRARLKKVREDYSKTGRIMPELDNPVLPPRHLRSVQGWISVYVAFDERQKQ